MKKDREVLKAELARRMAKLLFVGTKGIAAKKQLKKEKNKKKKDDK